MESVIRTHDGATVNDNAEVWFCYKDGKSRFDGSIGIPISISAFHGMIDSKTFCYFSTKEACQAYIDSMNQPTQTDPIKDVVKKLEKEGLLTIGADFVGDSIVIMNHIDDAKLVTQQIGDAKVTVFAKDEPMSDPMFSNPSVLMPPTHTPKPPVISVSIYNKAGEKIMTSKVCEFETGVHDGGLKNDMHQPIFEFTNETGKPITIKEGQRIAWKDGRVMLFDAPRTEFKEGKVDLLPNGQMATEVKADTKPLRSRNANLMIGDAMPDLHSILTQFSHAYNIPINTVLEFIVNQKSK